MFPRRCKKCRCYLAPHLNACPRCGTSAPSVVTTPTKQQQHAARVAQDAKVPTIHGTKIHWVPSVLALRMHEVKLIELAELLERASTARARNTLRGEVRATKTFLARKEVPVGKHGWTTEYMAGRHGFITTFISPKKHRYVLAERDRPADLLIVPALKRHRRGMTVVRLQRFEKSAHAKLLKKQQQETTEHVVRKKAKKTHRAKKKLAKQHLP